MEHIATNLAEIRHEMRQSSLQAGRSAEDVQLCVVTKTFSAAHVQAAYDAGERILGENRVQELLEKAPHLPCDAQWHIIGHLQSNKVRKALQHATTVHSVDSIELAQQISRIASEMGKQVSILLQVNIARDDAKFGFLAKDVPSALEKMLSLPSISINGLMTIPELAETAEQARPHFANLRKLRDQLTSQFSHDLPTLSMGMSGDFPAAIAEGSTLIRVGSRVFGKRG